MCLCKYRGQHVRNVATQLGRQLEAHTGHNLHGHQVGGARSQNSIVRYAAVIKAVDLRYGVSTAKILYDLGVLFVVCVPCADTFTAHRSACIVAGDSRCASYKVREMAKGHDQSAAHILDPAAKCIL